MVLQEFPWALSLLRVVLAQALLPALYCSIPRLVQLTGAWQPQVIVLCKPSLGVLSGLSHPSTSSFAKQIFDYPWARPTSLSFVRC